MGPKEDKAAAALQALSTTESTILGIAAGVIEVTILQPILYLKNASQQGLPFTLNPALLYRRVAGRRRPRARPRARARGNANRPRAAARAAGARERERAPSRARRRARVRRAPRAHSL